MCCIFSLQVQQDSPAKKPRLHCDVDNNLISSSPASRPQARPSRRGPANGREWRYWPWVTDGSPFIHLDLIKCFPMGKCGCGETSRFPVLLLTQRGNGFCHNCSAQDGKIIYKLKNTVQQYTYEMQKNMHIHLQQWINRSTILFFLNPMVRFLFLFPQRPATMTEVRRRPTGRWRRPRRWSSPSARPGPPSWEPSSPLSSTSSHQRKMVPVSLFTCQSGKIYRSSNCFNM